MNPFLEPAKRIRKERMRQVREKTKEEQAKTRMMKRGSLGREKEYNIKTVSQAINA